MAARALLFYVVCGCSSLLIAGHRDPIVATKDGKLKGVIGRNFDGENIFQFFGIPYAKPPQRFQLAEPAESWSGVRDASKVGDACISRDDFTGNVTGSEDCLFVNVYTRKLPKPGTSLRPVMVFIYGGGFTSGSSRPGLYGPEFLMLKDIVLVTFNYRLGILGFLSFDDPMLQVPGNLGLKDQILALKWVQQNIQKFNGNPNDVTIFGNSAGSSSVHVHILSPASRGLFHKAILQSGSVLVSSFWGTKNNAREIVSKAGKTASTEKEALNILKTLTASEIFAAQEQIYDSPFPAGNRPFSAVIEIPNEHAILAKNPIEIMKEGSCNQVPIIIGYNENEGMLHDLVDYSPERIRQKIVSWELPSVIPFNLNVKNGSNDQNEILAILGKLYSGKPVDDRYDPMTDGYVLVGIIETLRYHLKTAINPIYLYRMSLAGELNQVKRLMNRTHDPGVCHADELGYLFHTDITPGSLEDRSLRRFVDLWTNFAIHGNPTPTKRSLNVLWEPVENENNIRVLDIGEKLEMKDIPERNRLDVWWKILKKWPLVKFA